MQIKIYTKRGKLRNTIGIPYITTNQHGRITFPKTTRELLLKHGNLTHVVLGYYEDKKGIAIALPEKYPKAALFKLSKNHTQISCKDFLRDNGLLPEKNGETFFLENEKDGLFIFVKEKQTSEKKATETSSDKNAFPEITNLDEKTKRMLLEQLLNETKTYNNS
ncbi:hypothetical protein [Lihuaxuella thermophila]|uniref:Uncharacterized protein n=1 Tax=Lihuaxuella thermophila TaxID=1173111 RepID=A0A1H8J316_9BACL|nr:hypothetical protein [Lihuaxuella thermophila]SEN74795.1 hypothetical protein SAMN05444955_12110 [Lihuaxuella thermophila]